MKKITTIFLLMILCLSGCGFKTKPALVQENRTGGLQIAQNNTLLGWLKRGKTVACTVSVSGDKITIMVKNGKTRIDGIPFVPVEAYRAAALPENGVSLFDGGVTYMWDKSTLEGIKFDHGKTEDWEKMAKEWETAGDLYECREKDLSDDIFAVPANVQFQDLTVIPQGEAIASGTPEEMDASGILD